MHSPESENALAVIAKQWQLDAPEETPPELLLEALAECIFILMRDDRPKLMRALYTLDVSESRYNGAMAHKSPEKAALALAVAVLDRESEKIAMRKKYATESKAKNEASLPGKCRNV